MKTCISCAFASTVDHQAKYHIRIYASAFVYTFGPPIWRRSDGCQAFGHVIENDLYGCLISFSISYKLRTSCFKKKNRDTRGELLFSNYSEESGNSDCVLLSRRPEPEWIRDPAIFISDVRDVDFCDLILQKRKRITLDEISWFIKRFVRYSVPNLPRIER